MRCDRLDVYRMSGEWWIAFHDLRRANCRQLMACLNRAVAGLVPAGGCKESGGFQGGHPGRRGSSGQCATGPLKMHRLTPPLKGRG
jgi:hypothetical protein